MGGSTPIWLTILAAVLSSSIPLAGVLWNQRKADERAEKDANRQDKRAAAEAERRLEHQRESERFDKLFEACDMLLETADEMRRCAFWGDGDYEASLHRFHRARLRAEMVAPGKVLSAAAGHFYTVLNEWVHADGKQIDEAVSTRVNEAQAELQRVVRSCLGAPDDLPDIVKPPWLQRGSGS